jgi:predicted nucleic acid-binding protein
MVRPATCEDLVHRRSCLVAQWALDFMSAFGILWRGSAVEGGGRSAHRAGQPVLTARTWAAGAIYLNTSVNGRPFDDQSQDRVRQEAEAFVEILAAVVAGRLICLNSDILQLEVRRNPSTTERERIEDFLTLCTEAVAESAEVLHIARALQRLTLRVHDALHLASAAVGRADYFLTCDDRLVSRAEEIQGMLAKRGIPITVMSPRAFLGSIGPTGGEGV